MNRFVRCAVFVLGLSGVVGCHDPDAYVLTPARADAVLAVTVTAAAIPADGISRTAIVAQLDPLTDLDKRIVTFSTTAGTLSGGGKDGLTVTVPADTTGKATAELRSGTTPGTARLDVSVGSVSRSTTVEFSTVPTEELFDVTLSRDAVPADGFSTTRIEVILKRLGTTGQRTVKFEASAGTLLGAGLAGPRQANVPADSNGLAGVELQSDKTIGTARVTITALDRTREIAVSFVPADPESVIAVSADRASAPADGATPVAMTARVAAGLPAGRRSVVFRTTLGKFLPGGRDEFTIDADGSNAARAMLVSETAGTAQVTATIDGTTDATSVQFTLALPERVFVSPAASTLRSNESTVVTVTLIRAVGEVSDRLEVRYSATTSTGASIGTFSGITLSANGTSRADFHVGTTAYLGPVTIRAAVDGGAAGTAAMEIVP